LATRIKHVPQLHHSAVGCPQNRMELILDFNQSNQMLTIGILEFQLRSDVTHSWIKFIMSKHFYLYRSLVDKCSKLFSICFAKLPRFDNTSLILIAYN